MFLGHHELAPGVLEERGLETCLSEEGTMPVVGVGGGEARAGPGVYCTSQLLTKLSRVVEKVRSKVTLVYSCCWAESEILYQERLSRYRDLDGSGMRPCDTYAATNDASTYCWI